MIKIITIIGARPQIIKAAAISRAIRNNFRAQINEIILHTGQHYDANMSQVFFDELGIPQPDYQFQINGNTAEKQMEEMEKQIGIVLEKEKPNGVLVYGDTNSTFAGAKAAYSKKYPLIHIEAGLRSWNKDMPEERNRVYADSVSTLLFSPTETGLNNLIQEGFSLHNIPPHSQSNPKIYHCGDIMYDNSVFFSELAHEKTTILKSLNLQNEKFILATIHRNTNTDNKENLNAIIDALFHICDSHPIKIVLPLHPRTKKMFGELLDKEKTRKLESQPQIQIIEPVSFLDMIALEKNCILVMTDSGGVQKEAFYFKKPCVVLRTETEWTELAECGAAILAKSGDAKKIYESVHAFLNQRPQLFPAFYGDGHAAEFICKEIIKYIP